MQYIHKLSARKHLNNFLSFYLSLSTNDTYIQKLFFCSLSSLSFTYTFTHKRHVQDSNAQVFFADFRVQLFSFCQYSIELSIIFSSSKLYYANFGEHFLAKSGSNNKGVVYPSPLECVTQ